MKATQRQGAPLTPAQVGMWSAEQAREASAAYCMPAAIDLEGDLDVAHLEAALRTIVARHDALHCGVADERGTVQTRPFEPESVPFEVQDLRTFPESERAARRNEAIEQQCRRPIDLRHEPPVRFELVRLDERSHCLVVVFHHLAFDGWSVGLFYEELKILYRSMEQGSAALLPRCEWQYSEYARAVARDDDTSSVAYWASVLEGFDGSSSLLGKCSQSEGGRQYRAGLALSPEQAATFAEHGRTARVTPHMMALAAFAVLMHRLGGDREVVVGTPVANRMRPEVQRTIGFFVNMLPVRLKVEGTLRELLEQVRARTLELLEHQATSLEAVVQARGRGRRRDESPLVRHVFALQPSTPRRFELGRVQATIRDVEHREARFDLSWTLFAEDDGLHLLVEYATAQFERSDVEAMAVAYQQLLWGFGSADALDREVDDFPLLGRVAAEELVASGWGRRDQEDRRSMPDRVRRHVRDEPGAVAVREGATELSYCELWSRSTAIGAALRNEVGVDSGDVVALRMERGIPAIVLMLAIARLGAAYLPLDPRSPSSRIEAILADAGARVVVADDASWSAPSTSPARVSWSDLKEHADGLPRPDFESIDASDPLYIVYTSGTTGKPKGVVVSHASVDALVADTDNLGLSGKAVVGQLATLAFDAATFEIWGPLSCGGTVAILPGFAAMTPAGMRQALREGAVEHLFLTTALARELARLDAQCFDGLANLWIGGEVVEPTLVRNIYDGSTCRRLYNIYGPTETTTFATIALLDGPPEGPRVPIGRPMLETLAVVLDAAGHLLPLGLPGELHLGGAGVAIGYHEDPRATRARFGIRRGVPGERLYRTGDFVYWDDDRQLQFLGRRDHQVKIRGFRIELGEIEVAVLELVPVEEAVVLLSDGRLVAHVAVTPERDDAIVLQAALAEHLPDYAIPRAWVFHQGLPLGTTGKVDRAALLEPRKAAAPGCGYTAPRDERERLMQAVWAEALDIEPPGCDQNFYALGGDSLSGIHLLSVAQAAGVSFGIIDLLHRHPTVGELARIAEYGQVEEVPRYQPMSLVEESVRSRLPDDIEDAYPITSLQAGMLFHSDRDPGAYVDVLAYRLRTNRSAAAYAEAWAKLVDANPVLRTRFAFAGYGGPLQLVSSAPTGVVTVVDAGASTTVAADDRLRAFVDEQRQRGFTRRDDTLWRARVFQFGEGEVGLALSLHHALMDGWSLNLLLRQWLALVCETAGAGADPLPFAEHVALEQACLCDESVAAFWAERLGEDPVWMLAERWPAQGVCQRATRALDRELTYAFAGWCKAQGVHLKFGLLAAHLVTLAALDAEGRATSGVVTNTRVDGRGGETSIGLHLNTLPRTVRIGSQSWRELVDELARCEAAEHPHRHYPSAAIARARGGPLFDVAFNFLDYASGEGGLIRAFADAGVELLAAHEYTPTDLGLLVTAYHDVVRGGYVLSLEDNLGLGDAFVDGYAQTVADVLVQCVSDGGVGPRGCALRGRRRLNPMKLATFGDLKDDR